MTEEKKGKLVETAVLLICFVPGIFVGLEFVGFLKDVPENKMLYLLWVFLCIGIPSYMQLILYETGHLLFGLLTGYQFCSFRIHGLILKKENGKLVLKIRKIPRQDGLAGDCFMLPPEPKGGVMPPVFPYYFGAILLNAASSLILFPLIFFIPQIYLRTFVIFFVSHGLIFTLRNGIPCINNGVPSDAYVIKMLKQDKSAHLACIRNMQINAQQINGIELRDMPEEWFLLPEEADRSNIHISMIEYLHVKYLFSKKDFVQTQIQCEKVLAGNYLIPFYHNEVQAILLFIYILSNPDSEKVKMLYTPALKKYLHNTQALFSTQRVLYAYELLVLKDGDKAKSRKKKMEKIFFSDPGRVGIKTEKELMNMLDKKAEICSNGKESGENIPPENIDG